MRPKLFGTLPDGTEVLQYTLKTKEAEVRILNLGAIMTDFIYAGRNILLGFDTPEDYLADDSYQGALVGRVANRVKGARFTLNGKEYFLAKNCGENSLHGGLCGFNRKIFSIQREEGTSIVLTYQSPDGEEGYPGTLSLKVIYTLSGSSLSMEYIASSDADTPINITNHAYFNLVAPGTSVNDYLVTINADRYTESDEQLIPTGERPSVIGTPYDLRRFRRIGEKADGYDKNFILNKIAEDNVPSFAAAVCGGGLRLSVYTTLPDLQFYTACSLQGTPDLRGGIKKAPFTAFCLETQYEPDAPHHEEAILRAGEIYHHTTVYQIERE